MQNPISPLASWFGSIFSEKLRLGRFHTKMLFKAFVIVSVWLLGLVAGNSFHFSKFLAWRLLLWHVVFIGFLYREVLEFFLPPIIQWMKNGDYKSSESDLCSICGRPKLHSQLLPLSEVPKDCDVPVCRKCPTRWGTPRLIIAYRSPEEMGTGTESYLPPAMSKALRNEEDLPPV